MVIMDLCSSTMDTINSYLPTVNDVYVHKHLQ